MSVDALSLRTPPFLWWLTQIIGTTLNGYFLYHMVMLNIWIGQGITVYAIWKQLLFLTNINHLLVFIYHFYSLVKQIRLHMKNKKQQQENSNLQQTESNSYYQFLITLGFLVTTSYWILRTIDVRLVHGKNLPIDLGDNYTVFIHGGSLIILLLEIFIVDKNSTAFNRIRSYTGFILVYSSLLLFQKLIFNRDVYGFQRALGIYGFLPFFLGIPILILIDQFITQNILNFFQLQVVDRRQHKLKSK